RYVEIRRGRKFTVFGSVKSALEVVNAGANVNTAGKRGAIAGFQGGERRKRVESEVQLRGCSLGAEMLHLDDETGRQVNGIDEFKERASRIGAGNNALRGDLFAAREGDAGDSSVFHEDSGNFRVRADFCAGLFGRGGHRRG